MNPPFFPPPANFPYLGPLSFGLAYKAMKNGSLDFNDSYMIEMGLEKSLIICGKTKHSNPSTTPPEIEFAIKFKRAVSSWTICRDCLNRVTRTPDGYFQGYFYPNKTTVPPQVLLNAMLSKHKKCFVKLIYRHVCWEGKPLDDLILSQFDLKMNHLENLKDHKRDGSPGTSLRMNALNALTDGLSKTTKDYWRDKVFKEGTALHIACKYDYHDYLRLMLLCGANPDLDVANRDPENKAPTWVVNINDHLQGLRTKGFQDTALHVAAYHRSVHCVRILIQGRPNFYEPANPAAFGRVYGNETPIYAAIMSGWEDCVSQVCSGLKFKGALMGRTATESVDTAHHVWTPLMAAIAWRRNNLVSFLLKLGASVHTRARITGETALHVAVHQGNITALTELLHKGAPTSTRTYYGTTSVHLWTGEDKNILKVLLRHGADADWKDGRGEGLLHQLAARDDKKMMEKFFDATEGRLDIDLPTDLDGRTPLHIAAANNSEDCIEFLLEVGADAERVDKHGQNVLHVAASVGYWKSVPVFIEAGAKINQQDKEGNTPAHKAAQHIEAHWQERGPRNYLWPKLTKGGADLTIKNNQGQEPLDIVTQDDDDLIPTPTKTPPPVKSIKKEPNAKKRKSEPLSGASEVKVKVEEKKTRTSKRRRVTT